MQIEEDYTEKSFVVRGEETRNYKSHLKELKGRFNRNLGGKPGWVFSKDHHKAVEDFLKGVADGTIQPDPTTDPSGLPMVRAPRGGKYQKVVWSVFLPQVGMDARLRIEGGDHIYKVVRCDVNKNVVDTCYISADDGQTHSKLVIINGEWKIWGYQPEHSVRFSTPEQATATVPT